LGVSFLTVAIMNHVTQAYLAGVTAPPDIDGVNLWGTLRNPATPHRTEVLISGEIIRQGKWKLVIGKALYFFLPPRCKQPTSRQ
jgi:hypothetical protein